MPVGSLGPVLTPMIAGGRHGPDTVLVLGAGEMEGRGEMGDDTGFLFSEIDLRWIFKIIIIKDIIRTLGKTEAGFEG